MFVVLEGFFADSAVLDPSQAPEHIISKTASILVLLVLQVSLTIDIKGRGIRNAR